MAHSLMVFGCHKINPVIYYNIFRTSFNIRGYDEMSAREIGESIPPASVLVAGIDGSGKSTFLEQLGLLEYIVHEPTVTPMARNFKQASLNRLLDSDFISERESLYLGLNDKFDASIRESLENGRKVATSGNTLVTLLSHTVMRAIVSDSQPEGITKSVINQWLSADCFKPEALVLVHAPESVILERILERQRSGDRAEEFWGFNS